ncbi:MAG: pilus assembly protein [Candidatus Contendobacter odensis]|uniref:Type II secretion system protein H n=1 Tax=Candidatus Contendibacter odensensis TaxID=1400860 RepID=A0A2G6PGF5_9GAMM|nr:MAG: pilus assembly protein [Candidatus Contendobacter odensis]
MNRQRMNKVTGFTLIELMITLAIAAIILGFGVPSFQRIINNNQLTSAANALVASVNLARSEAVKRGQRMTICKSSDGASCTNSGGYQQGWIVFTDTNANAAVDAGEQVLKVTEAFPASLTFAGAGNVNNYISYDSSGILSRIGAGAPNGSLTLCKQNYRDSARRIFISLIGRIRIQRFDTATVPTAASLCP